MPIHAYIRVSTAEQADSGLGLEAQASRCRDYAHAVIHDDNVTVHEEHRSGKSLDGRPILMSLIQSLTAGDVLLVYRLDRLARNTRDLLNIYHDLESKHVALISVSDSISTTGPTGQLTLTMLAAMAQFERQLLSQRTKDALAAKRARGERCGRRPFACARSYTDFDDTRLQIVRNVFLLRRCGGSYSDIAHSQGLPRSTVRYVLHNPFYKKAHLL